MPLSVAPGVYLPMPPLYLFGSLVAIEPQRLISEEEAQGWSEQPESEGCTGICSLAQPGPLLPGQVYDLKGRQPSQPPLPNFCVSILPT